MVMALRVQMLILFYGLLLARAEVYLNCGNSISPVCYGDKVVLVCVTDTMSGHLSWHNGTDDLIVNFEQMDQYYHVYKGINFTLLEKYGIMTPTQRGIRISNAVLDKATSNMTIKCSDGGNNVKACQIQIKKIFQPKWATPPCTFSEGKVDLFWSQPSAGAECCTKGYNVTCKDSEQCSSLMINQTHYTLHLKNESNVTVTVHCVDKFDNPGFPSVPVLIQPKTDIEFVFIEPLDFFNNTNGQLVGYLINWKTKKPTQSSEQMVICSPQEIQNPTIVCVSDSNSYPAYIPNEGEFGYCCVPKSDGINVTLNLTNEADFESVAFATILASAYKDECRNNETGQNSTSSTPLPPEELQPQCNKLLIAMITFIFTTVALVALILGLLSRVFCICRRESVNLPLPGRKSNCQLKICITAKEENTGNEGSKKPHSDTKDDTSGGAEQNNNTTDNDDIKK